MVDVPTVPEFSPSHREDCEQLMNACANMDRLSQLHTSVKDICSKMAPSSSQKHCVHLSQFGDTPQTAVGQYGEMAAHTRRRKACLV